MRNDFLGEEFTPSKSSFNTMVDEDIRRCSEFLSCNFTEIEGKDFHIELASKYQDHILNFGKSLYGYFYDGDFFNYEYIGLDSLKHNIKSIMFKLIAFQKNGYSNPNVQTSQGINIINRNNNELSANQTICLSFEAVRQQIAEMTGLSAIDTKEVLEKVDEIKAIVELKESPKSKWEKVKPILSWISDKSVDVGIALLPLILNIK